MLTGGHLGFRTVAILINLLPSYPLLPISNKKAIRFFLVVAKTTIVYWKSILLHKMATGDHLGFKPMSNLLPSYPLTHINVHTKYESIFLWRE